MILPKLVLLQFTAMRDRRQWFEPFDLPTMALWWIPAGTIPTVAEAKARLEHVQQHGSTPYAFLFNQVFSPVESADPVSI